MLDLSKKKRMNDAESKERLLNFDTNACTDEFSKGSQKMTRSGSQIEMTQENLLNEAIDLHNLKAKIEEYLECKELTIDHIILLLKQGAEDNDLFMIKEETYLKLAESLELPLDYPQDELKQDSTGGLRKMSSNLIDTFRKANNEDRIPLQDLSRMSGLMETRQLLNSKSNLVENLPIRMESRQSVISSNEKADTEVLYFEGSSKNEMSSLNNISVDEEDQPEDPQLLEKTPSISNQKLKNILISGTIVAFSVLFFIIWVIQSVTMFNSTLVELLGTQIIIARG